eukprot:jgi/Botrbrau1/8415/Bobra.0237s0035.1
MFCSISGTIPEEPVINRNNGQLYEKRLVEKFVKDNGKDPVTGETLSLEDIVLVKSNKGVKPRPQAATSIPGLLGLLHNEWDAAMLETHTLRQSLSTVRQELSHALYQQDAACRVIARLLRERDAARDALESLRASAVHTLPEDKGMANGKRAPDEQMEEEAPAKRAKTGLTEAMLNELTEFSNKLSKYRKRRTISSTLITPEELQSFTLVAANPVHKTTQGILSLDLSPANENITVTGGLDQAVTIYDNGTQTLLGSLTGHTKKINSVVFLRDGLSVASASADKTVRIWSVAEDGVWGPKAVLREHHGEVTSLAIHPSYSFFACACSDKTWTLCDGGTGEIITQVADPTVEAGYTTARFHPDGLILGVGSEDSLIRIWEARTAKNVANFEGHVGPVTSLSFSENGYYLATSASDGVKLWDLRKLKNFRTIEGAVSEALFDYSGLYLAAAGVDARVYGIKQEFALIKDLPDIPKRGATCVRWGADAKKLFLGATDHNVRVYAPED